MAEAVLELFMVIGYCFRFGPFTFYHQHIRLLDLFLHLFLVQ